MLRSMFAGVSGLRNHQVRMDVIGNNIANVNTVGYKASRVTFKDVFSQTMRSASAPQNGVGGTNPMQIGLGMTVGTIDTIQTRSSIETTGKGTDLAIDGDGFFMVSLGDAGTVGYTRAGNFDKDANGYLVQAGTGFKVKGWDPANKTITDIRIPNEDQDVASETKNATVTGNLDASSSSSATYSTQLEVIDSLGKKHNVKLDFSPTAVNNQWNVAISSPETGLLSATSTQVTFSASDGTLTQVGTTAGKNLTLALNASVAGANNMSINVDFSSLKQTSGESAVKVARTDGNVAGTLDDFSIDSNGSVIGHYSNGSNRELAKIMMASFPNSSGLSKMGDNVYLASNNSGIAKTGFANTAGFGKIAPSSLEMSNVDLSQEFTNMITTQRGFQANSRVITTSDEMLQELVNLKRA